MWPVECLILSRGLILIDVASWIINYLINPTGISAQERGHIKEIYKFLIRSCVFQAKRRQVLTAKPRNKFRNTQGKIHAKYKGNI